MGGFGFGSGFGFIVASVFGSGFGLGPINKQNLCRLHMCEGPKLKIRFGFGPRPGQQRGKGKASQLRAASGRLVTDLEMNSTYRGAVEIFNLCRNLHPHDVLFAECIRTFLETTIDGRAWMHRLEASQMAQTLKQQDLQTYVPPTKKPNVRTDRSRGNAFDSYGLRPLCHPWKLLSAYEFLRQWQVVPLLVPTHYLNRKETPRTQWTEEGKAFVKTKEYRAGKVAAKAGVHFIAVRNDKDGYYLYPEEPKSVFAVFRHSWALVRRRRPHVVIIEALRMPSTNRTPTYNSQYCSLFFRPWTLLQGDS